MYRNAAAATIWGADLQGSLSLTDALVATFAVNYNHAEYDTYTEAPFWLLNPASGGRIVNINAPADGN
ncbi:hypothetical protein DF186_25125, partial [Enterococcus hirae]